MRSNSGPKENVLFVCTGNTCRSPMAAALFRERLKALGIGGSLVVGSAGVIAGGDPASENAVKVMRDRGIDLRSHRAVSVTRDRLAGVELVLTMTETHMRRLLQGQPELAGRVFVLGDLVAALERIPHGALTGTTDPLDRLEAIREAVAERLDADSSHMFFVRDVPDPFGGGVSEYESTAAVLDRMVSMLAEAMTPGGSKG